MQCQATVKQLFYSLYIDDWTDHCVCVKSKHRSQSRPILYLVTKSVFTKNAKRLACRSKLIKNISFPKRRNSMAVLYLAAII